MQKTLLLILQIVFLFFEQSELCCQSGWIMPPPPPCCCCCCCDYGWGFNSGWPPQPGCGPPDSGGQWGGGRRFTGISQKTGNLDIPWHDTVPLIKEHNKKDATPKFLATIATATEKPVCSGTIISTHFVLSSCVRCLHDNGTAVNPEKTRVMVVDASSRKQSSDHFIVYETKTVTIHPECVRDKKYNLKHDIGLVQTIDEIKQSSNVKPAKLPPKKNYPPNVSKLWVLAAYSAHKALVYKVKDAISAVKVPSVDAKVCKLVLNSTFYNETYNYCTPYHHDGRTDHCGDDFGAALSINNTVYGILIHKFACGRPGSAGSFVSVAYNRPWITKTVKLLSNVKENV